MDFDVNRFINETEIENRKRLKGFQRLKRDWPDMPKEILERVALWEQMYGEDEDKSVEACIKLSILHGVNTQKDFNE